LLRPLRYSADERDERLRGVWLGGSLGVVVTPAL
jgi:hypothetical protein